jgi:hypothetical protein
VLLTKWRVRGDSIPTVMRDPTLDRITNRNGAPDLLSRLALRALGPGWLISDVPLSKAGLRVIVATP